MFEKYYFNTSFEELDVIKEFTGCGKPCNYLEYKFLKERIPSGFDPSGDYFVFTIVAQTRYTTVEKEELLYSSSTMVAEVGGILGLFLGVSFMTMWDGAAWIRDHIEFVKAVFVKCHRGQREIW